MRNARAQAEVAHLAGARLPRHLEGLIELLVSLVQTELAAAQVAPRPGAGEVYTGKARVFTQQSI